MALGQREEDLDCGLNVCSALLEVNGLGNVVKNHHCGKQNQEDKSCLVDALFYFLLDIATHDRFHQQHQHQAAIQDGNRQHVKNGQIQADQSHELKQHDKAGLRCASGFLHDPHWSAELLQGTFHREQLSEEFED